MVWEGKIVGAGLGAFLGGPFGAAIGAAMGHAVDEWFSSDATTGESVEPAVGLVYSLASFLSVVARADSEHIDRKRQFTHEILENAARDLGLEPERSGIEALLSAAEADPEACGYVFQLCRDNDGIRATVLRFAWRVAAKDTSISDNELTVLVNAAQEMGCSEDEFYCLAVPFYRFFASRGNEDKAYEVLGVTKNASKSDIEAAYRRLSIRYHPDRHVDAAVELKELTAQKFAEINEAYRVLAAETGGVDLVGRSGAKVELIKPKGGDVVLCYFCDRRCRLPAVEYYASARCPDCQALLLFEEELALCWSKEEDDE